MAAHRSGPNTSISPSRGNPFFTPAVDAQHLYYHDACCLKMLDRRTGSLIASVLNTNADAGNTSSRAHPVAIGSRGNVLALAYYTPAPAKRVLSSFNIASRVREWTTALDFDGYIASANGVAYVRRIQDGQPLLYAIDEANGQVLWTWTPPAGDAQTSLTGNIVTRNLVFFSTANTTTGTGKTSGHRYRFPPGSLELPRARQRGDLVHPDDLHHANGRWIRRRQRGRLPDALTAHRDPRPGFRAGRLPAPLRTGRGAYNSRIPIPTQRRFAPRCFRLRSSQMSQFICTMQGVSKTVPPKRQIIKDISLSFFPGAKIGLLGLNGAGKSTVLRIMAGVDTDFTGEARPQAGIKVGYLEQEPRLNPEQTVRRAVEEGVGEVLQAQAACAGCGVRRLCRGRRRLRRACQAAGAPGGDPGRRRCAHPGEPGWKSPPMRCGCRRGTW